MASNSDIFDSIRIQPRGRKKKIEEERAANECQWEGCSKPGGYKAPAGRGREGQYMNFCIEHVREYNKNFNYFNGLSDDEVTKFQKESAQTGERPTWKMGTRKPEDVDPAKLRATPAWQRNVRSRHTADGKRVPGAAPGGTPVRKLKRLEVKALSDLGLKANATPEDVRTQYKALVKKYHPDANGGDRSSEERFRQIIQSYKQLRAAKLA